MLKNKSNHFIFALVKYSTKNVMYELWMGAILQFQEYVSDVKILVSHAGNK